MPGPSGERLGCLSDLQVFVTDVCSAPRICQLTDITNVSWNRKLDDVSEASVEVAISDPECCECMGTIEPWCHILHIIRNGEVVWQGPVTQITYGYNKVTFAAKDIIAYLQVTVPEVILDTRVLFPGGREITDLALQVLQIAFADRNACFLNHVTQTDLTHRPTLYKDTVIDAENGFHAFDGTYFDWFQILAQNGLDYTTIGLNIVLSVENANLQPLGVLTDEHILGEIELIKDGSQMANRVFVRYAGDDSADSVVDAQGFTRPGCRAQCSATNAIALTTKGLTECPTCTASGFVQPCFNVPCPAFSEATDKFCYGPIDRVINNGAAGNYTTAKQTADGYVKAGSIAPRNISFPSGTKLSPDTPWALNDMIPGQRIDAYFSNLCIATAQSFRLQEVDYQLSSGQDEEISISLAALGTIGGNI